MADGLATTVIVILAALLAAVSACAGALWWRARTVPLIRVAALARDLAERLEKLEAFLKRLEGSGRKSAGRDSSPRPSLLEMPTPPVRRRDAAHPSAVAGPTLISVPNVAVPASANAAAPELAERFGAVWSMAEAGASADAIARATGQPIGQVELILGLRRQLGAALQ